ncbi:MAG: hypothetical protein Q4G00_05975 [Clostridia bacterium]|nr:hypothetical protein [Clostridia bacterium]
MNEGFKLVLLFRIFIGPTSFGQKGDSALLFFQFPPRLGGLFIRDRFAQQGFHFFQAVCFQQVSRSSLSVFISFFSISVWLFCFFGRA